MITPTESSRTPVALSAAELNQVWTLAVAHYLPRDPRPDLPVAEKLREAVRHALGDWLLFLRSMGGGGEIQTYESARLACSLQFDEKDRTWTLRWVGREDEPG